MSESTVVDLLPDHEQGERWAEAQERSAFALESQNAILKVMAGSSISAMYSDFQHLHNLARTGKASEILTPGDQIVVKWTDKSNNNTEYDMPFNITHFGDVELEDGEIVPGIWLQSHYATPYGVQFGNAEALYVAKTELPAGTYNFTHKQSWGNYVKPNVSYQFTLTKPVPAGGQLRGMIQAPDMAYTNWRISSYKDNTTTTAIETVTVSEGSEGTTLGVVPYDTAPDTSQTYPLNCIQRVAYGNNRWQNSAMEQWLNSKADAGAWWTPRDEYDVPPDQLASKPGFMSGFSDDFLSVLGKVKVQTAKNTTAYDGSLDTTYDTFFLPSLEQMYINKQADGEGDAWEYWKRALGLTSPSGWYDFNRHSEFITYALENHTSAQYVRLRSANRGDASNTWNVNSSGAVYSHCHAWNAWRSAPACVII